MEFRGSIGSPSRGLGRGLCCAITGVLAVLVMPARAGASTALALDVAGLTSRAEIVARGKVERTTAVWSDDRRRIETIVEVSIVEQWKGPATRGLTIVERGGALDGLVQRALGAATWSRGEEVVVFVARERIGGARFRTIGLAQGKLDVIGAGGATRVVPSLAEGLELVDPSTKTAVAARVRVMPLDALRRAVLTATRRSR